MGEKKFKKKILKKNFKKNNRKHTKTKSRTSILCILDNVLDVIRCVDVIRAVRTLCWHFWKLARLVWERNWVYDMPVENLSRAEERGREREREVKDTMMRNENQWEKWESFDWYTCAKKEERRRKKKKGKKEKRSQETKRKVRTLNFEYDMASRCWRMTGRG